MQEEHSIHRLQRSLHKQRARDIRSYLLSIKEDSEFALDVASAYGLPVLGNLRNGLWYVPPSFLFGKCYFKSTDGHDGKWAFSTTRLNLNVAEAAAECEGCIIVDSTRSGKLYPDALTATVPIWCAVVNRIVFPDRPPIFHGPEWLADSSKHIIASRIDEWVQSVPEGTRGMIQQHLADKLTKPLMPLWVCPSSFDSEDLIALPDDHIPVVLVSASKVISSEAARELHSWVYVQGAGDDEENWALGLTAQLFWDNADTILSSDDPAEVQAMVRQVVQSNKLTTSRVATSEADSGQVRHWWLGSTGLCVASVHSELVQQRFSQTDGITGVCTLLPSPLFNGPEGKEDQEQATAGKLPSIVCELTLRQEKRAHPREYWVETLLPAAMRFYGECSEKHSQSGLPGPPRIVVVCETGQDASAVVATALLCRYFQATGSSSNSSGGGGGDVAHSKSSIRQRLQFIQFHHPMAQPPRRLMKELNNFLLGPAKSQEDEDDDDTK